MNIPLKSEFINLKVFDKKHFYKLNYKFKPVFSSLTHLRIMKTYQTLWYWVSVSLSVVFLYIWQWWINSALSYAGIYETVLLGVYYSFISIARVDTLELLSTFIFNRETAAKGLPQSGLSSTQFLSKQWHLAGLAMTLQFYAVSLR